MGHWITSHEKRLSPLDALVNADVDAAHDEALWAAEFVAVLDMFFAAETTAFELIDEMSPDLEIIADDLAVMQEVIAIETLQGILWGDACRPPLTGIDVLRAFAMIDAGLPPELYDYDLVG